MSDTTREALALSDLSELAKVYASSYASPHHITFTVEGLRNLLAATPTAVQPESDPFKRGKQLRRDIARLDAERQRLFDEYCSLPPFKAGQVDADDLAWAAVPLSDDEVTTEQCLELAAALEQRRAVEIVEAVHNLPVGGRTAVMPSAFQAGYCSACEEIDHRLRTEVWEHCLAPMGFDKPAAAHGIGSASTSEVPK
jgi:hypothetical protein